MSGMMKSEPDNSPGTKRAVIAKKLLRLGWDAIELAWRYAETLDHTYKAKIEILADELREIKKDVEE